MNIPLFIYFLQNKSGSMKFLPKLKQIGGLFFLWPEIGLLHFLHLGVHFISVSNEFIFHFFQLLPYYRPSFSVLAFFTSFIFSVAH